MISRVKGKLGEDEAAAYLEAHDYKILARNFNSRRGEVDIIARQDDTIVFFEVKNWDVLPVECLEYSINPGKRKRILAVSQYFLYKHPEFAGNRVRFDIIFIQEKQSKLNHIENAFNGV